MAISYKKNSIISLIYLFFQSGYSAVLGLVANIIITTLAAKDIFGIYATVLATNSIINYISDIGLAGALIQKKDVNDSDLKTVFTIQQLMIITIVVIGLIATPSVMKFYSLSDEARLLYHSVLIGFFISSLKTIPSVKLERTVNFKNIVKVQIVENTIFYIIVSLCMILGLGITSFTVAVLTRSVVGTLLIYVSSPWKPAIMIDTQSLKKLLAFGIPFQTNSILALIKDDLMIIFLGKSLGLQALGEIMWAKKWADAPIRIFMDNVTKVFFPLVSRLQDDTKKLKKTVVSVVWIQFILLLFVVSVAIIAMPHIIYLIPKYSKWENALPMFYLFSLASIFSTLSTPLLNVFNALKKPSVPLYFMIFWTTTTWLATPPFIERYGAIGFAYIQVALSSTFVIILFMTKYILKIDVFDFGEVYKSIKVILKKSKSIIPSPSHLDE
jgi:O-antigen/teichoic acid export membrane protein